jgi:hypothetical protein
VLKLEPVIVTTSPIFPNDGFTELIIGRVVLKVKPSRVAVPIEVVIAITPDVPGPTTAAMTDAETTENEVAGVPPKLTEVVPVKFSPLIVTTVPALPATGVNDEIIGPVYVNPGRVATPLLVLTLTSPEAPVPRTAMIVVGD